MRYDTISTALTGSASSVCMPYIVVVFENNKDCWKCVGGAGGRLFQGHIRGQQLDDFKPAQVKTLPSSPR